MDARCPHCQNVFPTDRTGVQHCPSCGQQVNVAHVAQKPLTVPAGESGAGAPLPAGATGPAWEQRASLGAPKALFQTVKESLFNPAQFWSGVRHDGPWLDALLYAWILGAVGTLLALPLRLAQLPQQKKMLEQLGDMKKQSPQVYELLEKFLDASFGTTLVSAIGSLVMLPLILLIAAGIWHLIALLVGAGQNGFWATFRAYCYSSAPVLFSFIPCVAFVAAIYQLVLFGMGLRDLQRTTTGKATTVVLLPIGLFSLCCCAGMLIAVAGIAAAAGK